MNERKKTHYTCPMHESVKKEKPGTCPKCGMELVSTLHADSEQHAGHQHHIEHHIEHHKMMAEDFKKRFWVSLLITIPVLLLSPTIQQWAGIDISFPGQSLALFLLASFIALWGAWPFYKSAIEDEMQEGRLGMMTLVSLAVGAGYLYSAATTFLIVAPDFYWEIATLTVVLLLGHWMEMRAVIGTSGALEELAKLIPPTAHLVQGDNSTVDVSTEELSVGDTIRVRPGEKIPIDGTVIAGSSAVNEALITGESKPVHKEVEDSVIGGALVIDGSLTIRVSKTGEDTAVAQIVELVRQAQESKPQTQKLADKAAHYLTLVAIIVGVGTLLFWTLAAGQSFVFALTLAMTVVVITCPHALGLAIPTVTTISTTLAAKNGILVKDMDAVERAQDARFVMFDKTGTLTSGSFSVTDVVALKDEWDNKKVLQIAASVDKHSEHTIAHGIVKKAEEEDIDYHATKEYRVLPGKGGVARWDGKTVTIGNATLMKEKKIAIDRASSSINRFSKEGKTVVFVAVEKELVGLIALADTIRPEAYQTVAELKSRGIKVAMVTGDNKAVARSVAQELNLDRYFAEVLPENKSQMVAELQKERNVVMMVGDGINDAPALAQSDVAVAIGAGTDVAIASAHVILVKDNPLGVVHLIELSRKTMSKMKQNLAWATSYNLIAIPLAAGALAPLDIFLRPEWGALVMSASSVIVVLNALLLKRVRFNK